MKNISLEQMLTMAVKEALNGYPSDSLSFYYKNGDGEYHEIVELDLFRGRFITDNGDFSEFSWECRESHIYIPIGEETHQHF